MQRRVVRRRVSIATEHRICLVATVLLAPTSSGTHPRRSFVRRSVFAGAESRCQLGEALSMVSAPLTSAEQARHERAIEKIRRQLFRKYTPADYFIVPASEHVFAAYAEGRWNEACGAYRVLHLGGISYSVDCADAAGLSKFHLSHAEADRFNFWLTAMPGHTISALNVRFCELDEIPYAYVSSYRRANLAPKYVGHQRSK